MVGNGGLFGGEAGNLLSLTGTLANAGDPLGDFLVSYAPVGVPLLVAASSGGLVLRYRHRRRAEMRITAEDKSMTNLERMRVPRGQKASQVHPGMPAVTLRKMGAKKTLARIESDKACGTTPGRTWMSPTS